MYRKLMLQITNMSCKVSSMETMAVGVKRDSEDGAGNV